MEASQHQSSEQTNEQQGPTSMPLPVALCYVAVPVGHPMLSNDQIMMNAYVPSQTTESTQSWTMYPPMMMAAQQMPVQQMPVQMQPVPPQMQQMPAPMAFSQHMPQMSQPLTTDQPPQMGMQCQMPPTLELLQFSSRDQETPLDTACDWSHAAPQPCCGDALVQTHAPSEASTCADYCLEEIDDVAAAPLCPDSDRLPKLSGSAQRRRRRKRAAERQAQEEAQAMIIDRGRAQGLTVEQLRGQVWMLSQGPEGCRAVQKALESGREASALITQELAGHVVEASKHMHANFVIQVAIKQLSVESTGFIVEELQGFAAIIARNKMGCRIFCRLIEFCSTNPKVHDLVDELLKDEPAELCCHPFAHHVAECILEHGQARHQHVICRALISDAKRFAQRKQASFLIEKVMTLSCHAEDQAALIKELDFKTLLDLAYTQFGRHVAKTMLKDRRWYEKWNETTFARLIAPYKADLEADNLGSLFLKDMAA